MVQTLQQKVNFTSSIMIAIAIVHSRYLSFGVPVNK